MYILFKFINTYLHFTMYITWIIKTVKNKLSPLYLFACSALKFPQVVKNIMNGTFLGLWIEIHGTLLGKMPVLREYISLGFILVVFINLLGFFNNAFDFINFNFFEPKFFVHQTIYPYDDPRFPPYKPFGEPYGGRNRPGYEYPPDPKPIEWAKHWAAFKLYVQTSFTWENIKRNAVAGYHYFWASLEGSGQPECQEEKEWRDAWRMHFIEIVKDRSNTIAVIEEAKRDLEAQVYNENFQFQNRRYIEIALIICLFTAGWLLIDDAYINLGWLEFSWDVKALMYFIRLGVSMTDVPLPPRP
jgi:hypothetical protein